MSPQEKPAPKTPLERQIDENLRRVYQQALDEAVPDRFLQLLSQLKDQGKSS